MLDENVSDGGQTDEADKAVVRGQGNGSGKPRTDSPFLDMESGRASPMGDSFGESVFEYRYPRSLRQRN